MPSSRTIPILLATLALVAAVPAAAGVWTTGGPNAPSNASLAMAPSDPNVLYLAAGDSGLFGSRDAGATWTALANPLPGNSATSIAVHPTSPTTVYALVGGHLFRSADGGSTWSARQSDHSDVIAVSIDTSHPSTVYTGTPGGVYRSTDDGASWTSTGVFVLPSHRSSVWRIFFHPARPSTVFASVFRDPQDDMGAQLWRSDDAGETWRAQGSFGHDLGSVASVVAAPNAPETLYAMTELGLFRSTDDGNSWTALAAPDVGRSSAVAIDPTDSSRLFVSQSGSGIAKSTDGGATWTPLRSGLPQSRVSSLVFGAESPSALYAGTADGVFKSADAGATWASSSAGIKGSNVLSVAIDRADPALVYAGTDQGIYATADGGRTWKAAGLANNPVQTVLVDPLTPSNVFAATAFGDQSGLYKSADGGRTWAEAHTGMAAWGWANALAIDPTDPANLYVSEAISSELYKSTDGAASWARTTFDRILTSIAVDPANSSVIYGADDYFGLPETLVKSTDGGTSWSSSGSGLPASVSTTSIDPTNGSVLYAGTPDGVYKSTDAAVTWTRMGSSLTGKHVPALAIDPRNPATLYAATDQDGVYRSTDGGVSWQAFNEGLTNLAVTSLAIDPVGSILHAGTVGGGVFETSLEAVASTPCTPGPGTLCLLGDRFRVTVAAQDPARGRTGTGHAVSQGDRFGYFSFPDFTGDRELPEVVVKMVDATVPPWNSFWFFYSGMTNLPYVATVTDTATGAARVYRSDGFCGAADTSAFPAGGAAIATPAQAATALSAAGSSLALLSGRFRITLAASNPRTNRTTEGTAIPQGDRFGYFSLPEFMGDPNFPEVFVKMIDATSFSGTIWLFHTGLTNLPYSLRVEDTATGSVRTYENEHSGTAELCGGADTSTFPPYTPPITGLSGTWTGTERDRGLTDDYFCPSQPRTVSVQITQSGSHVSFSLPLGYCAGGGAADFYGSLTAPPNGIELGGPLRREAAGTSCALTGGAGGTAEASHIHLEGTLGGSCNQLGIEIDLTR